LWGTKTAKIFEPSKGGNGKRLKIASKMLRSVIVHKSVAMETGRLTYFKGIEQIKAVRRFEAGPTAGLCLGVLNLP